MQAGGWSPTWGNKTTTADNLYADSLVFALRRSLGTNRIDYRPDGTGVDLHNHSAIVTVAAEAPYAEVAGYISFLASMRHSSRYPRNLETLRRVRGEGVPAVALLYSGPPVAANDLINRSDAFIAAWLPGTEGMGLADMLLVRPDGRSRFDFTGRLSFDWPPGDCLPQTGGVQFARGYGLSLTSRSRVGHLPEAPPLIACAGASR
ncbi:MAG: glycoside hydrolase family 3 protein [Rhizorhabdus sp.]|nr:glycoside hydrolase family 3 protein [Rhizorhabdus sp.]